MYNLNSVSAFEEIESSEVYQIEAAKIDFALELKRLMDQRGLNNAGFAELLGVSRPMVSKLLSGDTNVTVETMAKAAHRLGSRLFIKFVRRGCDARLFEVVSTREHARRSNVAKPESGPGSEYWDIPANDVMRNEIQSAAA